ncbi:lyase family protein [Nocardioides ungokensis]|uniref:lyase family protein n=1 Tax=Nocardioides ungokensis TaxID=1643322 RepID=UPI0015DEB8AD|nr:lyase family protein [Nocardioides ungokensis]
MSDLFWPGDERAGGLMSGPALLAAMVRVEAAWLSALVEAGVAPAAAKDDLADLVDPVGPDDVEAIATGAESGGNPVIGLVGLLRSRVEGRNPDAARWLHRGLTSQDVLDTGLLLCVRDAVEVVRGELTAQVGRLADLADGHAGTLMAARTLTQHAVPLTFGLKAAGWLGGVLDAYDAVTALRWPAQLGGAAGTRAAWVELAAGLDDPGQVADDLAVGVADRLGLAATDPWHTNRAHVTRIGDALVGCTDAWGRIANDVLVLSRPEIGELSEGAGGGSSTMPHKANPVLSTLVRRAALTAPQLGATLHLAATESVDERADGGWHAEWAPLRDLARRTAVAASQTTALLDGLEVHADRMRATHDAALDDLRAEQRGMADLAGRAPAHHYLGTTSRIVDAALARARTHLQENR